MHQVDLTFRLSMSQEGLRVDHELAETLLQLKPEVLMHIYKCAADYVRRVPLSNVQSARDKSLPNDFAGDVKISIRTDLGGDMRQLNINQATSEEVKKLSRSKRKTLFAGLYMYLCKVGVVFFRKYQQDQQKMQDQQS